METMTVREAIKLFPGLLDEVVTWGEKHPGGPFSEAEAITLQFKGDGNYRTRLIHREENPR